MPGPILPHHLDGTVPYYSKTGKVIAVGTLKALTTGKKKLWKKGESGNPGGRPAGMTNLGMLLRSMMDKKVRDLFDAKKLDPNVMQSFLDKDIATALLEKAIKEALNGDMNTLFQLWEKIEPSTHKIQLEAAVMTRTPQEILQALREAHGFTADDEPKALPDGKPLTLLEFYRADGYATNSPVTVMPFHKEILTALAQVLTGKLPGGKQNLGIFMPPRHGKTRLIKKFVEYGLGNFPDSQFIYTSYSSTLATNHTRQIMETIQADWYRELFPAVQLKKSAADLFQTTAGGQVYGVGMTGTIIGEGAGVKRPQFGGALIIDDPLNADDARSPAALQHCQRTYTGTLLGRRNWNGTPIVLIMQRLAPDDLVGYIAANEAPLWHFITFEGLNEVTGHALWPETRSAASWNLLKAIDPFSYWSQSQQKPQIPGGNMIHCDWWGYYNAATYNTSSLIYLTADTALKAKTQNDDTSMGVWHATPRFLDCLDNDTGKMEFPELLRRAKALWKKWQPHGAVGFYIEDKASGPSLYQMLAEQGIPCIPWSPQDYEFPADKVGRVKYSLFPIAGGRVRLPDDNPPWVQPFIDECAAYSGKDSDIDNQVDMTTMAVSVWVYKGADLTDLNP